MQPRICPYCWKTFSNSFNLKQHTINVHIQSQGVACDVCEKVVKNKWYLRKHLVTAHGAPLKRSTQGQGKAKTSSKVNNNEEAAEAVEAAEDDEDREEVEEDNDDEEEINVDEVDEGSKPTLAVST